MKLRKIPEMYDSAELDGEIVIIHADTGKFFALKDVGLEIWKRLDGESDVECLCEGLSRDYDADDATIRTQVHAFCDELVAAGFARFG